jgi:hypothetical protein
MSYTTIQEIIKDNKKRGKHFFDQDTLRFWQGKVYSEIYAEQYFITSEQYVNLTEGHRGTRTYTVRQCVDGKIETIGKFQGHATITDARRAILALLEQSESSEDIKLLIQRIDSVAAPTVAKSACVSQINKPEKLTEYDTANYDEGEE